jgi:hypothetical protein
MDNTTQPANEQGTNENATRETTNTENAVTEQVKPASIWRLIEKHENKPMFDLTEAFETSQGVVIRNTLVESDGNFSSTLVFVPAVKIVELHDGSLTIK